MIWELDDIPRDRYEAKWMSDIHLAHKAIDIGQTGCDVSLRFDVAMGESCQERLDSGEAGVVDTHFAALGRIAKAELERRAKLEGAPQ